MRGKYLVVIALFLGLLQVAILKLDFLSKLSDGSTNYLTSGGIIIALLILVASIAIRQASLQKSSLITALATLFICLFTFGFFWGQSYFIGIICGVTFLLVYLACSCRWEKGVGWKSGRQVHGKVVVIIGAILVIAETIVQVLLYRGFFGHGCNGFIANVTYGGLFALLAIIIGFFIIELACLSQCGPGATWLALFFSVLTFLVFMFGYSLLQDLLGSYKQSPGPVEVEVRLWPEEKVVDSDAKGIQEPKDAVNKDKNKDIQTTEQEPKKP